MTIIVEREATPFYSLQGLSTSVLSTQSRSFVIAKQFSLIFPSDLLVAMGNVCIVISDPRRPDEDDNEVTSTSSSQSSQSGHGSSSFTKRLINLSSKRLLSMKKTTYSRQSRSLDSPVWQRGILMGERCEPPDFSGVILYDEHGNHVQEFPCKSPRHAAHPALPLVI